MSTRPWTRLAVAVSIAAFAASAIAEDAKKKDKKLDPEKVLGKWSYMSSEKGGEKKDEKDLKQQEVEFSKDSLVLKSPEAKFVLKYKIDASKTPATIALEIVESPFGVGDKAVGLLELDGDELKICYAPGDKGPESFETKTDSPNRLVKLKRMKTEK